jgi:hypothetical protein
MLKEQEHEDEMGSQFQSRPKKIDAFEHFLPSSATSSIKVSRRT